MAKVTITPDMNLRELIMEYPDAAKVLGEAQHEAGAETRDSRQGDIHGIPGCRSPRDPQRVKRRGSRFRGGHRDMGADSAAADEELRRAGRYFGRRLQVPAPDGLENRA